MNYNEKYFEWLTSDVIDQTTKQELRDISDDIEEIENRFYKNLEFGTGGLRGIIGAGTNMINQYTIMKATQGIANYINKHNKENKPVLIAYDSRRFSKKFSEVTALCLNENGIQTYMFTKPTPTPELSFAMRHLNGIAGIMITASHNSKEYNGYKLYWEGGGQITPPMDRIIIEEVNAVKDIEDVKIMDQETAIKNNLYHFLDSEIDTLYNQELLNLSINKNEIKKADHLSVVYSPLHGVGNFSVSRILKDLGITNYYVVEEQAEPDEEFPTLHTPNPEEEEAFTLSLKLAREKNADIILTTDADADRVGIYVKDVIKNKYIPFTGNMSAIITAHYILSQLKEIKALPSNGALISTIVSTKMGRKLAEAYGIQYFETLTGFKYIGELINSFEEHNEYEFIFGYEESYGFLNGTHVRDKDGIAAVSILCEIAAYYKNRGLTLVDQLKKIYKKYGHCVESSFSITLKGKEGIAKTNYILNFLRASKLENIGPYSVEKIRDYNTQQVFDLKMETIEALDTPKSNVLYYELINDSWICIRPSGTEPKLKIYFGSYSTDYYGAEKEQALLKKEIQLLISNISSIYEKEKKGANL